MAEVINLNISVGTNASNVRRCPTSTTSSTPVFSWTVPEDIDQRRFNIRIESIEPSKIGYFTLGDTVSQATTWQYPTGNPFTSQFIGVLEVEIVISENATTGTGFEYTSGVQYFVYDPIAEQLYNTQFANLQWANSTDPNPGQTILYNVLVSQDPSFQDPGKLLANLDVAEQQGSPTTSTQAEVEVGNDYFWKVRSYDGLDYSDFTVTHGFTNLLNFPPEIQITGIYATGNTDGDVIIYFDLSDLDEEDCHIEAQYTGGNVADERTNMSLINPLGKVTNGSHAIIWRSGRNEQQVSASDYVIFLTAYDTIGSGPEAYYGPFALDNSNIGGDQGGIGASDIEFPIHGYIVNLVQGSFDSGHVPVSGALQKGRDDFEGAQVPLRGATDTWKVFAQTPITDIRKTWINPEDPEDFSYDTFGYSNKVMFPHGFDGYAINETQYGIANLPGPADPEGSHDPPFVATLDYVNSLGEYGEINEKYFSLKGERKGFMRFKNIHIMDKEFCEECGGKGWQVSELIDLGDGKYQRQPCSSCNGSRFSEVKLDDLGTYVTSDYKPMEDWITPDDIFHLPPFSGILPNYLRGNQFIWGSPTKADTRWPKPLPGYENFQDTVHQLDCASIDNDRYGINGVYPGLYLDGYILFNKVEYDYEPGTFGAVRGSLGPEISIMELGELPLTGSIREGKLYYIPGYSPEEADGFVNRATPTHRWERGIWKFKGSIGDIQPLEPLKIIYLQTGWDIYNTIHWQSTMSSVTRIHLQVSKYFEDGSHTSYYDVIGDSSEYIESAGAYMTEPNKWHLYWDTVRTQLLEEGYDYRLRIRQFDIATNTASSWVYGAKFNVDRKTSNPPNILSTEYEKWSKTLKINFRIDDSQKDNYDITRAWYSSDGRTFYEISTGDLTGNKLALSSDNESFQEDGVTPLNMHTVYWETNNYNLEPGDKYRVRLETIPTAVAAGLSPPYFQWSKNRNPILWEAERQLIDLYGQTQTQGYNDVTDSFVEYDPPIVTPGRIDVLHQQTEDMRNTPEPSGMYAFMDPSGNIIDPSGYHEWSSYEVYPNVSRGDLIYKREDELDNLVNVEAPKWMSIRDEAERGIRKNLIDQGFYNNGFEDNNPVNRVFRFRVETMAHGDEVFDGDDYQIIYRDRYNDYYVMEFDFLSTFDSQSGGRPLREFLYDKFGEPLQGGDPSRTEVVFEDHTVNIYEDPVPPRTWSGVGDGEGQPWDTEPNANGDFLGEPDVNQPQDEDARIIVGFTIAQEDLPGERADYFLNNSFPSVSDELPDGLESFNTDYYWRVASYNLVPGTPYEIAKTVINNITVVAGSTIEIDYTIFGDEALQTASITHIHYSMTSQTPAWTTGTSLSFPTDRPTGYEDQDDENPVVWVPYGLDRSRPSIVLTDDHQYYLWYSKAGSNFGNDTILHSRGKNTTTFGEYDVAFPDKPNEFLSEYAGEQSAFSPCVLLINGVWHMWMTVYNGVSNRIAHSTSSNADDWTVPVVVTGVNSGSYSPWVYYDGETVHMWYCEVDGGYSKIFYATSSDGVNFTEQNSGNSVYDGGTDNLNTPCIINNGGYIMYFTKFVGAVSKIYSVTSTDGISWSGEQVEIDIDDTLNPCVIVDTERGNEVFRMYYNVKEGSEYRIETAFKEADVWANVGDSNFNQFLSGDYEDVACSKYGNSKTMTIHLSAGQVATELKNMAAEDDVLFRLGFSNDLATRDFKVQSTWITQDNADEYDAVMRPDGKYTYDEVIKNFKYGNDFNNV